MVKTYHYDGRFWEESELDRFIDSSLRHPNRRISKTIAMVEGKKVLDLGCGIGIVSNLSATKLSSEGKVIGIDFLSDNINIANEKLKRQNTEFRVGDVNSIKLQPASFDCILLLEVIEHVEEPAELLQSIHGLLKPNGYLIISTPNAASTDTFFQNLKSIPKTIKSIDKNREITGTERDHLYTWTLPILYRLLNQCGFRYVKHEFVGAGFPFTNIDRRLGTHLSDLFSPIFSRFGMGIILKVRKI